jgi:hypothetical protein
MFKNMHWKRFFRIFACGDHFYFQYYNLTKNCLQYIKVDINWPPANYSSAHYDNLKTDAKNKGNNRQRNFFWYMTSKICIQYCGMSAGRAEPEETAVDKQQLSKNRNTYTRQQQRDCWRLCYLLGLCRGYIRRTKWGFKMDERDKLACK